MILNYLTKRKKKETLIRTMRIYSQDIGMEFGIEKRCYDYNEKGETTEGIKSRKHQKKENYKYL